MLTDSSGLYAFQELPLLPCSITWIYEVGSRKMRHTQTVVPPSEYSVDVTATASITGVLVSASNIVIDPRRIELVKVRPGIKKIRSDNNVGMTERTLDFMFEDCVVTSDGVFIFHEIPSGTYAIVAPGTMGRGPVYPALFPAVVISLQENEIRTVQIICP
jgi:hypothetical protein